MLTGSRSEWLVLAGALVLTVVLWRLVARSPAAAELRVGAGIRNGLIVCVAIIASLGVVGALTINGTTIGQIRLDLLAATLLGLIVGGILAVAYFGLGLLVMPIGVLLGGRQRWVSVWTWAAIVPIAIAIGLIVQLLVTLG